METVTNIRDIIKNTKLNNPLSLITKQTKVSGILKDFDSIGDKEFLILENPFLNNQNSNYEEYFVFIDEIEALPVA